MARREVAARPSDHDHAHLVVALGEREGVVDLLEQGVALRVAVLRAVEGDGGDGTVGRVEDVLEVHVNLLCAGSWLTCPGLSKAHLLLMSEKQP